MKTIRKGSPTPLFPAPRRTQLGAAPAAPDSAAVVQALDALIAALGLDPGASPDDVASALDALFGADEGTAPAQTPKAPSTKGAPDDEAPPQRKAFPGGGSPNAVGTSKTRESNLAEARRRGIIR